MAYRPTQKQLFAELEQRYGAKVAEAFMAAIHDLRTGIELQRMIAAIQAGDIEGAIAAMHLDAGAYDQLLETIRAAYSEGGAIILQALPAKTPDGLGLVVRFSVRNPRAEAWLQEQSSRLVTRIMEEQRVAVRQALTQGLQAGANPRTTALDIVGRVSRATGQRTGGLLGLTADQTTWAQTYASKLSGKTPSAAALGRKLRDRRFDRTVAKAIREGKSLPAETQAKMVTAYRNKALRLRGEMIGRVETMTALQSAKREGFQQAIDGGQVNEADVERRWRSAHDMRVRDTHAILDGKKVRGLSEPFVSASGARLLHPMDASLGAGADEIIGCRCDCEWRIDWLSGIR